jgi:hypothetical protein
MKRSRSRHGQTERLHPSIRDRSRATVHTGMVVISETLGLYNALAGDPGVSG